MKKNDSGATKGVEAISRIGYAAKGLVYLIVGVLATLAAFGLGGKTTGTQGAVRKLAEQPFGQILLVLLAAGLAGHVVWRFTQGFADPEHKGNDFKGLMARAGLILSGLIYGGLAFFTLNLLIGAATSSGGGGSAKGRTAVVMSYPGGRWIVAAVGLGFIGVGIYQAMRAYRMTFRRAWDTANMSPTQRFWATRIARAGLTSRAVVFWIVGLFMAVAAIRSNPQKAEGLDGALEALARQPYGWILLGLVAVGLVCYGVYCFVNARFRHINP